MLISFLLLLIVIFALITIVFYTLRNGISPMPSGPRVGRVVGDVLGDLPVRNHIVELGAGWGSLALALAQRFPESQIIGYENSPVPFWVSRILRLMFAVSNVWFLRADFYGVSLSECNVVVCYLYVGAMEKLKAKFEAELQPGTYVISHTFAVPGWEPERVIAVSDLYRTKVYVYCV